jgi:hypothetical protein
MKYPQEDFAAELHRELTRRFETTIPPTRLSVEGAGMHWRCTAERDRSKCTVACLGGPEYYTTFERDERKSATARTPSREDTLAAVERWLQGADVPDLYACFPFVDRVRRALSRIRDDVLAAAPEVGRSARCELRHLGADIHRLRFEAVDRSCELSFYGKDELPNAVFAWDGCELFRFQPDDHARLAALLKRWLCDRAMPSAVRAEFPWVEIGPLADYYEQGNPVEGEFLQSWDRMERFYDEVADSQTHRIRAFLAEMRKAGYDRTLRAGQSLFTLVLSRSRRHGLRPGQPWLAFSFHDRGVDVQGWLGPEGEVERTLPEIALTPEVESLLRRLAAEQID